MKSVPICELLLRVNQQTGNISVVFTCLALVSVILKSVPPHQKIPDQTMKIKQMSEFEYNGTLLQIWVMYWVIKQNG